MNIISDIHRGYMYLEITFSYIQFVREPFSSVSYLYSSTMSNAMTISFPRCSLILMSSLLIRLWIVL